MSDTPKLWRDMTDAEKGALLLAHHEGKVVDVFFNSTGAWGRAYTPIWSDDTSYRIRPDPLRLEIGKLYRSKNGTEWECIYVCDDVAWFAQVLPSGKMGTGYRFNLDGTFIDLGEEYNIAAELP